MCACAYVFDFVCEHACAYEHMYHSVRGRVEVEDISHSTTRATIRTSKLRLCREIALEVETQKEKKVTFSLSLSL